MEKSKAVPKNIIAKGSYCGTNYYRSNRKRSMRKCTRASVRGEKNTKVLSVTKHSVFISLEAKVS